MQVKIQCFCSTHLPWHQEHCSCFPWGVAISATRSVILALLEFHSTEAHIGNMNLVGKMSTFTFRDSL